MKNISRIANLSSILGKSQVRYTFAYSSKVMEYNNNPKNIGTLDSKDKNVGTGLVGAPACGDVMKLQIKVNDKNGKIEDAVFKVNECKSNFRLSDVDQQLPQVLTQLK